MSPEDKREFLLVQSFGVLLGICLIVLRNPWNQPCGRVSIGRAWSAVGLANKSPD